MRKAMKILLAVDGSEYSLAAVEEVARTPWPEGSVIRIVSVAEILTDTISTEWEQFFEARAIENVTRAIARFGEIAGARTEVTTLTLKGNPKKALLDEAELWGADLIVVGTHSYNAFERLLLGSVSRAVATHAKCSVQIVRPQYTQREHGGAKKILLAVDGSECSRAAVEEVANRPWPEKCEVNVISAINSVWVPTPEIWTLSEIYLSQMEKVQREQAERAIRDALLRLNESNASRRSQLKLTSEMLVDRADEAIIETAKAWNADLIIVGSHGYHGFERFLLGSVSQAVALHAPCTVEIVRRETPEAGRS
jgi:nucleotide-binding universal stress UspA family protein